MKVVSSKVWKTYSALNQWDYVHQGNSRPWMKKRLRSSGTLLSFKEGHYHVQLQWYDQKIESVPSNHNAALRILERVEKDLEKRVFTIST